MAQRILLFLFLLFLSMPAHAQESTRTRKLFVAVRPQAGFFWTHRYNMGHLVKKQLLAFEADVWLTTTGQAHWHKPFHFPQIGLSSIVIPLGNPEQLGTAIGLYPYINFPLGEKSRRFKTHFLVGWGLGWLTKKFDPETNHKNIAIGTHLNTIFSLRLNTQVYLNNAHRLDAGIGIIHFSNGGARVPNLGMNLPMLSVGYSFRVHERGSDANA
ncbi:MAG: acyloxyacyl hydrolase, partial [Bacteroidia bacterium]